MRGLRHKSVQRDWGYYTRSREFTTRNSFSDDTHESEPSVLHTVPSIWWQAIDIPAFTFENLSEPNASGVDIHIDNLERSSVIELRTLSKVESSVNRASRAHSTSHQAPKAKQSRCIARMSHITLRFGFTPSAKLSFSVWHKFPTPFSSAAVRDHEPYR